MGAPLDTRSLLLQIALNGASSGGGGGLTNPIPTGTRLGFGNNSEGGAEFDGTAFGLDTESLLNAASPTFPLVVQSGNNVETDGSGTGEDSGNVTVRSGDTTAVGAGSVAGGSGQVQLSSGDSSSSGGGISNDSGDVQVNTGTSADGNSGFLGLFTGDVGGGGISGDVDIFTGISVNADGVRGRLNLLQLLDPSQVGIEEVPLVYNSRQLPRFRGIDVTADQFHLTERFDLSPHDAGLVPAYPDDARFQVSDTGALSPAFVSYSGLGIIIGTVGTAIGDGAVLLPSGAVPNAWAALDADPFLGPICNMGVFVQTLPGNSRKEVGFRADPVVSFGTDGADGSPCFFVRHDPTDGVVSSTNWVLVVDPDGATPTIVDTGVPVVADTDVVFTLIVDPSSLDVILLIDGVLTNSVLAVPFTGSLGVPYTGLQLTTAGVALTLGNMRWAYDQNTA